FDLVHVHGFDVRLGGAISKRPLILGTSSYGPTNCADYLGWGREKTRRYHRRLKRIFRLFGIYDACSNVRNASRLIVWSEYARSLHLNGSKRPDRIAVIPPGVDVPLRSSTESIHKAGVLFVGRDFRRKGGEVLLEAWRRIGKGKERLIMIGFDGTDLPDWVEHHPYVAPQVLRNHFYANSRILAFPTLAEG
ncbi:MAG: glycosyltransferase, partial [Armatimonadetes bacterium]|nr:glycosyltransferase [Armatimonadota bacterium]NIO76206.1 glycosyltransferase [Armatimonadota bacterium]NIO98872.1 glycosyltransferase [Armatimonadota bacterium]